MAIIGDGDSVLAFRAGGIDAFSVVDSSDARILLKKIAKEYQVIFITDILAKELDMELKKYLSTPYPIILSVPSAKGSNGYGNENIKRAMEKALGVDILFNKDV
ncbi:MAG: V-type ATP synthase subunit F [Clostridia bacterium]|nr:V-type ATP synthase subunit F [Clostridia bacterium]